MTSPFKLTKIYQGLTSKNQLLKRKLKLGTSEIPIPAKRDDVATIEAINRFNKANPRADTTNLKPLSVKHSKNNEGEIQSAFDTATREAQFEGYPAPSYEKFKARYLKKNMKADGGMLVQPSDDGSRPGYAKVKKKDEYSRIMGLSTKELKEMGFTGQKSKRIDGVKKLTDEFKAFIREQTAASPDYRRKDIQFKSRELRVINAIENAYNQNDVRHIITKDKFNKIGNFKATDYPIITAMKKDPEKLKSISAQTGIAENDLLNLLEDRDVFIKNKYNDVRNLSVDERTKPKKKFYASAEKWILRNSKRYADPDKFYNAFIRTFGKDNHFIQSIESGKKTGFKVAFSDEFVTDVLGLKYQSSVNPNQLKNIFKTSIYTNNPNVRKNIVNTLTDIIPTDIKFAKDYDVRNALLENPLLKKFGLNESIKGPIAKLLADDLIDITLKDISSFRRPFLGTKQLLGYLTDRVDPKYKSMFQETAQAVEYAQKNQWQDAKAAINLSQNIMFDHKIPQALIKLGYADDLDYIKLTPTSADFNTKIKLKQFDQPMVTLANEFSRPTTSLDRKAEIVQQMKILQTNFNSKYGNYLGSIDINYNDKTGKLKLTNLDPVVTKQTDLVSSLGKSLTQSGDINKTQLNNLLKVMQKANPQVAKDMSMVLNSGIPIDRMAAEIARIPGVKPFAKAFMKLGGPFEVAFAGMDIANEVSKGAPLDTAFQTGISNVTFGALGNPEKYQMRDLSDAATEIGLNTTGFQELKNILDLEKKIIAEKKLLDDMQFFNEESGGGLKGNFNLEEKQKNISDLEKQYETQALELSNLENYNSLFEDYNSAVEYLARKEYNKTLDSRKDRVYPDAGTMGSDFMTTFLNPIQSFLPQNLMETTNVTRPLVRGLRKLPIIGGLFDPTSDAAKLSAMSQEEKDQRALDMNIIKQNYHPVMGTTMTGGQMQGYYDKFFSKGGIASLTKTIPPESGPTPHGLPYVYNNVKKI